MVVGQETKEELLQRVKYYQTMIDAISQAMYLVDVEDMTVLQANRSCPFYDDYKATTRFRLPLCGGNGHPYTIDDIKKTQASVTAEHVHVNELGEERIVEVHGVPIFDEQGKLKQVVEHCVDISERTQLERQLRHAQKMESIATMAAGIAHDFNNLLTVILGFSDLAHSMLPDDNEVKPYLHEVVKAGRRARNLVSQILSFSREAEMAKQPICLAPILKETVKLLKSSLPSTIELRLNIDANCGSVLADPTQIHQVLMNLCTNAFQAMEVDGGVLDICMERTFVDGDEVEGGQGLQSGPYVRLRITDTGTGMDTMTLERIFEPYFSTKSQGKGSGLGLSVAHGIINAHGGEIIAESVPGQGSDFFIYLPEIKVTSEGDEGAEMPGGNERLVFVDDEESIVILGQKMLESLGYRVTVFKDSLEALSAILASPEDFDLLLSDCTMPGLTGVNLAKKIKEAGVDMPVILFTGYSKIDEVRGGCEQFGVLTVLGKPFEKIVLANSIRAALSCASGR